MQKNNFLLLKKLINTESAQLRLPACPPCTICKRLKWSISSLAIKYTKIYLYILLWASALHEKSTSPLPMHFGPMQFKHRLTLQVSLYRCHPGPIQSAKVLWPWLCRNIGSCCSGSGIITARHDLHFARLSWAQGTSRCCDNAKVIRWTGSLFSIQEILAILRYS